MILPSSELFLSHVRCEFCRPALKRSFTLFFFVPPYDGVTTSSCFPTRRLVGGFGVFVGGVGSLVFFFFLWVWGLWGGGVGFFYFSLS